MSTSPQLRRFSFRFMFLSPSSACWCRYRQTFSSSSDTSVRRRRSGASTCPNPLLILNSKGSPHRRARTRALDGPCFPRLPPQRTRWTFSSCIRRTSACWSAGVGTSRLSPALLITLFSKDGLTTPRALILYWILNLSSPHPRARTSTTASTSDLKMVLVVQGYPPLQISSSSEEHHPNGILFCWKASNYCGKA